MGIRTISVLLFGLVLPASLAKAQQPKVYRVGVITAGGAWYEVIDGLRAGLKQLGLEEGKQFILAIRDTKGDAKAAEEAARNLEKEKFNLVYTTQTSVTLAAKRATADISIVFCAGADPVDLGFVESFAKPGGRLTGVFARDTDLTAKRLEILKEIVPKLRRVVAFYFPAILLPTSPPNWRERLRKSWESNSSSVTSFPSNNFKRVSTQLRPGGRPKWMPSLKCKTRWCLYRIN